MKILFIVNPISGGVDKEPFLKEATSICDFYGINFKIFKTTGKNDEQEVLKVLENYNPDKVASVGGDGTTLFTAIALLNTNYPMGIIPLGSANGMATELFVKLDPIEALKDIIMSHMVAGLDMLLINDEHYTMHIGDVGINANIVEAYEKDPNRGMATYAKYFIEELKDLKPFKVTLNANGESITTNVFMSAICNARKYGTGVPLNVVGNPMDEKFEIVLIEQIDLPSLIKAGLSSFDEKYFDNQKSKVIATKEAELIFEEPRLLQLDGEVIKKYHKVSIKMLPGAIKLITNKGNKNIK
ncbi:diacylglycerol/lipid kinase family protein [Lutibacter holmesii]|uniref:Diacylglycerol/lipid kinase family protein n=1 Tax=Lutibacter holmesii TaxID=1137985 RepID=A0ABW3WJ95_9FLAO